MANKRIYLITFLLFWLTYVFFASPVPTAMGNAVLQTTVNVVDRHTLEVSRLVSEVAAVGQKYYASFGPGGWLLSLPHYFVFKPAIARLPEVKHPPETVVFKNKNLISKEAFYLHILVVWFLSGVLTAFLLVQIERFCLSYGLSRAQAFFIAAPCGLGTILFAYSAVLTVQALAHVIIANVVLWHINHPSGSNRRALSAGFLLGLAVWVDYAATLSVVISSVFLLTRCVGRQRLLLVLGFVAALTCLLLYHWKLLGNPFLTPYHLRIWRQMDYQVLYKGAMLSAKEFQAGYLLGLGCPKLDVIWELTFGTYKGIFVYCPILLMGLAGHIIGWVKNKSRDLTIYAFAVFAAYLLFNSSLKGEPYWSGLPISFGPRYLIAVVPFSLIGLVHFCPCRRWLAALWPINLLSIFINLLGAMYQNELWRLEINNPILTKPIPYYADQFFHEGPVVPLLNYFAVSRPFQQALFLDLLLLWLITCLLLFWFD